MAKLLADYGRDAKWFKVLNRAYSQKEGPTNELGPHRQLSEMVREVGNRQWMRISMPDFHDYSDTHPPDIPIAEIRAAGRCVCDISRAGIVHGPDRRHADAGTRHCAGGLTSEQGHAVGAGASDRTHSAP